jgi:hypothetical protein
MNLFVALTKGAALLPVIWLATLRSLATVSCRYGLGPSVASIRSVALAACAKGSLDGPGPDC